MITIPSIAPFQDRVLTLCDEYNQISAVVEHTIVSEITRRDIEVELVATGYGTLDYRSYLRFPSEADRLQFLLMVGDFQKFKFAAKLYLDRTRNLPYYPIMEWWDW